MGALPPRGLYHHIHSRWCLFLFSKRRKDKGGDKSKKEKQIKADTSGLLSHPNGPADSPPKMDRRPLSLSLMFQVGHKKGEFCPVPDLSAPYLLVLSGRTFKAETASCRKASFVIYEMRLFHNED